MNRILQWIDDEISSTLPALAAAETAPEHSDSVQDAHCIFTPIHYERNYAYPLVVWLHGPNDDERQVTRVMPLVSARNFAAVGPRGTLSRPGEGFVWSQSPPHIETAGERVASAIAHANRWLNVAPHRIFLAGLGGGGTMALRLALNEPRKFAGALSIGGAFPTSHRPLAQLLDARQLRIFLACGRRSLQYTEAQACASLRLLHAAGMSVSLRQYPSGDDLTDNMLSDMNRWIMEQLSDPQSVPEDQSSARRAIAPLGLLALFLDLTFQCATAGSSSSAFFDRLLCRSQPARSNAD